MIEIKDVSFKLNKENILENVSLKFRDGSFNLLLGKNGSGKTTLMNLMGSVFFPDKGHIMVGGKSILENDVKKQISYAPSTIKIHEGLKAREFIQYIAGFYFNKIDAKKRIDEVSEKLFAKDLLNKKFSMLSLGEIKKVILIQALIRKSNIYIFDEPLSNLDFDSKNAFIDIAKKLHKNGATVIITSHELDSFEKLPSSVYILKSKNEIKEFDKHSGIISLYKKEVK